ncbi:MAG: Ig-like domain-containing protein [Candidatus Bipolaricaulaceae bacterium]
MRLSKLAIGLSIASIASVGLALEIFPVQVVFVKPDTPTPVVLAVGTPAELETLRFVIVEPPKYGTLLGIPPELVYVPKLGFLGTDWFSFLIQTAEGQLLDFGTVQLRVLAPVPMPSPALRFEGMLTFSGPPATLDAYSFMFGVYARFQYLDVQALASFTQTGFTSFQTVGRIELEGTWPTAWRFPVTSTLTFNPAALSLTSWTVDVRTTVLGWTLAYFFYYSGSDPQTGSYATFTVQGALNGLSLTSRTKITTLRPTFDELALTLRGPWFCGDCPVRWTLEYMHKKTGFEKLSFTIHDVPVPCAICGLLKVSGDVLIQFTVQEKLVKPTLRVEGLLVACLRPIVSLITPPEGLGLMGIEVDGIEVRCDLPPGLKARFVTAFDPADACRVTGDCRFFELLQFEGPVAPCCGAPGWWQTSFYFSHEPGYLFGLALTDINVFFPLSREVLVNVRLKTGAVDPLNPAKKWVLTLGWKALF